jgi:hypothetical protein
VGLLPGVVPDIPESRAGLVPARLARKVAPLFGLVWAQSPHGLTWVSEYGKITLSDMARGAPGPPRSEAVALERTVAPGESRVVDRAVVTHRPAGGGKPEPLPNEIANATLTRFGPDTKAAVVLTATNLLLAPVTAAVTAAVSFIEQEGDIYPWRLRLAAWASLVLEAFRSQPALFAAAVRARSIQRSLLLRWPLPRADRSPLAKCEVSDDPDAGSPPDERTSPADLEVADRTVRALRLPVPADAMDSHALAVQRDRMAEELTSAWLERLMALGTVTGDGYLWTTERRPGHRVVEALAALDPTLYDFLNQKAPEPARADQDGSPASVLDPAALVPSHDRLAGRDLLTRRAVVLAVTTMVRITFRSGDLDPGDAERFRPALDALDALAVGALDDDPVVAVTQCRVADMRLEVLRQDVGNDELLPAAVDDLLAKLDRCRRLVADGHLDRSDAAELIRSANVELAIVLRRHGATPIPGLLAPAKLTRRLYQLWAAVLDLMQIDLDALPRQSDIVRYQIGYQLHNYASFLCGRTSVPAHVERGLELFETLVIPAREIVFGRTGDFRPLLWSYQNVTRATTALADIAGRAGRGDRAAHYAGRGRQMIERALRSDYGRHMLEQATVQASDEACRFALLAAPALLAALDWDATDAPEDDLAECERLASIARTYASRFDIAGRRYARKGEIEVIEQRLDAYRGRRGARGDSRPSR